MAITPQTNLKLLKSTLSLDNMNQIKFASATAQYNYFNSLTKLESSNFTYQRKDNVIRYPAHIDTLMEYDYCMYQNSNYTNKWFYAYIVRMEYVNDNMTNIYIKTDPYQTWQFNITFKKSFVEREHVNNDSIGANTVPEQLETGEYKIYNVLTDNGHVPNSIVLASTVDLSTISDPSTVQLGSGQYNGIYSGVKYYRYDSIRDLEIALNAINNAGFINSVICMFMFPSAYAPVSGVGTHAIDESNAPITSHYGVSRISELDGYTPKNKKLLTYPFCYVRATNGMGASAIYRQEVWETDVNAEMVLEAYSALVPGGSVKVYPVNYNGTLANIDEGFSLAKYPQLSWNADLYTNWEVTNGVNMFGINIKKSDLGFAGSLLQAGGELVKGNAGSALKEGFTGAFSTMQEKYQHQLDPASLQGSLNSADVSAVSGMASLRVQRMGIKQEFAKKIDDFLSAYGYKVNDVKIPNITGRRNWNYVKTIDCNIEGYIPQEDLAEIKGMFNNGVTIWHNPSTFLDYSQNNDII